ncbi:hypothetical protein SASPL_111761 [Salvia splendens]|uniref:Solute carrier family 35, member F1/2 n=1 Tax=Salvia splendens TaxID=180675 RepID=A0A8X8Y6Z7_SALSN|nr:hypothetical protein SASPL_111761 [Salvia splendens]
MSRTLQLIFLGQLVSLDLAVVSFTVSLITNQVGTQVSWYWYVCLAFVDVQGNYLVTKAYQYTSITSVTLLDCCTIAWAILLTWMFLGTRYVISHFLGVSLSLLGLALVVLSDYDPTAQDASEPLLGDILVIAGTLFLAMSNVGMELCVKKKDRIEVMAMIGVFGMLITGSWMATYERKSLGSITWSPRLVYSYVGCTIASFTFCTLGPLVLKMSGATLFNLSLLTSDMWVLLIRIFIYKQQVKWLYYPAYALVILGIFIYLTKGSDEATDVVDDDYCIVEEQNPHFRDGNQS